MSLAESAILCSQMPWRYCYSLLLRRGYDWTPLPQRGGVVVTVRPYWPLRHGRPACGMPACAAGCGFPAMAPASRRAVKSLYLYGGGAGICSSAVLWPPQCAEQASAPRTAKGPKVLLGPGHGICRPGRRETDDPPCLKRLRLALYFKLSIIYHGREFYYHVNM